jgi:uncharacterized protein YgiM (DUF1202 family)
MSSSSMVLPVLRTVWCVVIALFMLSGCGGRSAIVETFKAPQVKRFVGIKDHYYISASTVLREKPDRNAQVVTNVSTNTMVQELFRDNIGWSRVRTVSGKREGWLPTSMLLKDPVSSRPESRPGAPKAAPRPPVVQPPPKAIRPQEGPVREAPIDDRKPAREEPVPLDESRPAVEQTGSGEGTDRGLSTPPPEQPTEQPQQPPRRRPPLGVKEKPGMFEPF